MEILSLMAVAFISIVVIITTTGIASIGAMKTASTYDAALESYFQRLLNVCFAAEENGLIVGLLDEKKITTETLEKCLQHNQLGIAVFLDGKEIIGNDYFKFNYLSCSVEKKPYSCREKTLRLLVQDSDGRKLRDVTLKGVLHHGTA